MGLRMDQGFQFIYAWTLIGMYIC